MPTFTTSRAKATTDAKAQGLDSQTLLGHASESSHPRYLRSEETPIAQPVSIGQSKTKATGTRIK